MSRINRTKASSLGMIIVSLFLILMASPGLATGEADEIQSLKEKIKELDDRLNKAELHTATDKISFGVELRSKVDSLHYDDISAAPSWLTGAFMGPFNEANYNVMMGAFGTGDFTSFRDLMVSQGMVPDGTPVDMFQSMISDMMGSPEGVQMLLPVIGGFSGVTQAQAQALMGMMAAAQIPVEKYDADNDTVYTNKFRLEMAAKVNQKLSFGGRMAMYKVFGDSSGYRFMTGSPSDVYLDGNTSSLPHGDDIHLERAFFNYKFDAGSIPANVSLGRRPATDGSPLEYGNYGLVGGSPMAPIINWQFDGASMNFGLEEITGIPGFDFKLCYGVGYESDWGNSYSLNGTSYVDDATFGGFIATLYNNDLTSVEVNYAHAWNITDGFTGLVIMPFIPSKNSDGTYAFTPNTGGYVSRMEASTNIGDFDLATVVYKTNFSEKLADIDFFFAPSWSRTNPDGISRNPFYELMGQGLVSTADANGDLDGEDGYSIYTGVVLPMPLAARLGLEFNYGSKYWLNMTGAEDSLVASKMAARGKVYEAYYIQPIVKKNFFVKLGTQYYDYDYTGSGNPLGEPVKIDDLTAFDAMFPVIDKVWNLYASTTLRF
ncbi:MAG: DUF3373 family protein [Thermodesulfobacteriota bacterium]